MGTTAEKLTYLNETKTQLKDMLNLGGASLTTEPFRQYVDTLKNRYLYFINNGTQEVWDNWEKVVGEGTTITLNNTEEAPMKINLKGNTSQATSILPSEYTQVDYIESSGTQYIDTGVAPSTSTGIDITYIDNNQETGTDTLIGSGTSTTTGYYGITRRNNQLQLYWGNAITITNYTFTFDVKHNIKFNINSSRKLYIDDVAKWTVSEPSSTLTSNTMTLFAFKYTSIVQYADATKLYSCKIYDGANLVRNFVPCYRNSDNEVGLYDLVNNVFYTNAGTGAFTYGAVATLPNPDYPQDIHVVSGDNSINVCGKNLISNDIVGSVGWGGTTINYEGTSIKISKSGTGGISANAHTNIRYFSLEAGKTYTFSMNYNRGTIVTEGATYGWVFYIYGVNKDGSTSSSIGYRWTCGLSKTTTTPSNHITFTPDKDFIGFKLGCYITGGSPKTDGNVYFDCQVEVGEATPYEAYKGQSYPINLGDKELCWIPNTTYTDRIFQTKTGDAYYDSLDSATKESLTYGKWYLNKQIGKVVLNGSEEWKIGGTYSGITQFDVNANTTNIPETILKVLSNYFRGVVWKNSWTINKCISIGLNIIRIMTSDYTTVADFKAWLSEHNTEVYYVLETPTYTEITDSTLLSQLEALLKARSYDGQTNITQTNNDLPFIINATALKEMS